MVLSAKAIQSGSFASLLATFALKALKAMRVTCKLYDGLLNFVHFGFRTKDGVAIINEIAELFLSELSFWRHLPLFFPTKD